MSAFLPCRVLFLGRRWFLRFWCRALCVGGCLLINKGVVTGIMSVTFVCREGDV